VIAPAFERAAFSADRRAFRQGMLAPTRSPSVRPGATWSHGGYGFLRGSSPRSSHGFTGAAHSRGLPSASMSEVGRYGDFIRDHLRPAPLPRAHHHDQAHGTGALRGYLVSDSRGHRRRLPVTRFGSPVSHTPGGAVVAVARGTPRRTSAASRRYGHTALPLPALRAPLPRVRLLHRRRQHYYRAL
jgi:hypothetical protein